ncbi:MAG: serine hydrolase [Bacteroidota bacterium]
MIKFFSFLALCIFGLFLLYPASGPQAYPIDGYAHTGISRLARLLDMDSAQIVRTLPAGGRMPYAYIRLNLMADPVDSLPLRDEAMQEELIDMLPSRGANYGIAVADISPGREPRYAAYHEDRGYQPGSVGKLAVATAIFCELENLFVDDLEARFDLLEKRIVAGGPFAVYDHHTIPVYDTLTQKYTRKQASESDRFSIYEWIDHMLSVSNNGAASIVWREAILMRVFGQDYLTLTEEEAKEYFRTVDRRELSDIANSVVNEPLRHLGISEDEWRLGTMFTRGGSNIVPPQGGSIGSPVGLLKWLVALESGRVIDPASSLEIKRLMYMTDRRIRYAHSPSLDSAAVFFKSGSLYSCGGGPCKKYHGTKMNFMNSVAIVEQPKGDRYLVALMSNVLGRNSAYDHQLLASRIDNMIRQTATSEAKLDQVRDGGE